MNVTQQPIMKKLLLLASAFLLTAVLSMSNAQPYLVGHKQQTFIDASRSNRNITTEIYYPATAAGDNVPIAAGQFPVVVFGHGFVMVWSAYANIWNGVVPTGYIMVFPTTETSFSPNHLEFGKDLAFLVGAMKAEGSNASSSFYGGVANTSAVMGHSMGGGASFLAAQFDPAITALATLAPANTTPSSITAAKSITIPSLVFAGANDCVTPPVQHQIPMYDSLASSCKSFVSITGGSHCQFANYNFNCSFGEGTCTPQPTITAAAQQGIVTQMLIPWLDFYLKADCNGGTLFQNQITAGSGITSQQNCVLLCNSTGTNPGQDLSVQLSPNPFTETALLEITGLQPSETGVEFTVYDLPGREVSRVPVAGSRLTISRGVLNAGVYLYKLTTTNGGLMTGRLIIR